MQLRRGFSGLSSLTHVFAFWYHENLPPEIASPICMLTLACRFEITGCAVLDAAPGLPIPPGLPQASVMNCQLSPALVNVVRTLANLESSQLLKAYRALEQTALVADHLNRNGHKAQFWKNRIEATIVLGPAAHYALSVPRLGSEGFPGHHTGHDVLCEMVRLALLMLIAGMKKAFSLVAGEMTAFQQKFDDLLPLTTEALDICPELGLWCMIVVACTRSPVLPHSLIMNVQEAMARMSIDTATQAIEVASSIIWVDAVMATGAGRLIIDIDMARLSDGT